VLNLNKPILSICLSCRDKFEDTKQIRAGKRFSENVLDQIKINRITGLNVRGVNCMSQCKRSCIISLTAKNSFTYIFGDIKPSKQDYVKSLLSLISIYSNSEDGFLKRSERPDLYQSNILGRIPPIVSNSSIVTDLYKG
jgi:predicted metal-binding protein